MTWLTRRRIKLLFIAAFIIGAIEFLPAYPFEGYLNRALPLPWNVAVTGSVWDGYGVLRAKQGTDALTVPLTWKFNPVDLLRLRASWTLTPSSPALSGSLKVGAGWQAADISELALTLDAETLQQAMPMLAIFAPSGTLFFSTPSQSRLSLGYGHDLRVGGEALIKADNLGLRPVSPTPLGSYQLKITGRDMVIDYVVTESSGALKLDGGGSIQTASPRQIGYSGYVTPSAALPENVLSQLRLIGQPAADGRLRIDWKARW